MTRIITQDSDGFWWIVDMATDQVNDVTYGPYHSLDEAEEDVDNV